MSKLSTLYITGKLGSQELIVNTIIKREESDSVQHRAMPRNAWPQLQLEPGQQKRTKWLHFNLDHLQFKYKFLLLISKLISYLSSANSNENCSLGVTFAQYIIAFTEKAT